MLRKPQLSDGFRQRMFKGRVREGSSGVCDPLVHSPLAVGEATGGVTGVNVISPGAA